LTHHDARCRGRDGSAKTRGGGELFRIAS